MQNSAILISSSHLAPMSTDVLGEGTSCLESFIRGAMNGHTPLSTLDMSDRSAG